MRSRRMQLQVYPHDRCGSFYLVVITDPERSEQAAQVALRGAGAGEGGFE